MLTQDIIDIAEKIHLMMDVVDFRAALPGIPLAPAEKNNGAPDGGTAGHNRVFGNHRISGEGGAGGHCFFTFDSGKLTFFEINAQLDYSESNYTTLSYLFERLLPVLSEIHGAGKTVRPLMEYREFNRIPLPTDGYPCDRYVIGAMHRWEDGRDGIDLSFALMHPGYLFFQLRAIRLA